MDNTGCVTETWTLFKRIFQGLGISNKNLRLKKVLGKTFKELCKKN